MSLFRTILATVAAAAIVSPVFADETAMSMQTADKNAPAATSTEQQPAASAPANANTASAEDTKLNINKATAKDLMKIKGINAAKARAIVSYRKKHPFTSTAELSKVKGFKQMKPDMMKEIEEQVSIE